MISPTASITCPRCAVAYAWRPEFPGRKGYCRCGAILRLPADPSGEVGLLLDDTPASVEAPVDLGEALSPLRDVQSERRRSDAYDLAEGVEPEPQPASAGNPVAASLRGTDAPATRLDDPSLTDAQWFDLLERRNDGLTIEDDPPPSRSDTVEAAPAETEAAEAEEAEIVDELPVLELATDPPLNDDHESAIEVHATPLPLPALGGGRCPSCGSALRAQAILCLNCGYNVQQGTKIDTRVVKAPAEASSEALSEDVARAAASQASHQALRALSGSKSALALALESKALAREAKWIDLYLPAALVVLGVGFGLAERLYFGGTKPGVVLEACEDLGLSLAVMIPLQLFVCVICAHVLDASFGNLSTAILKLAAVAIAPGALGHMLFYAAGGGIGGAIVALIVMLVCYYILIAKLFSLDRLEMNIFMLVSLVVQLVAQFSVASLLG